MTLRHGKTHQIREITSRIAGEFTWQDVAFELKVTDSSERKNIRSHTFGDMIRSGEIERVSRNVYRYAGRSHRRNFHDKIWHLVRSHRHFNTDQIERLSGAKRRTVLEYLNCLQKLGYLRKTGWQKWQLMKDPGPATPSNDEKRRKLKQIRAKQKESPRHE